MSWSDDLNPETATYAIASTVNPRVRVVAGPGTGKSFSMKRRVARLLESGVAPSTILPVTFTRVAAEDMHRELVGMDVPGCDNLKGFTLHSLALRILMRNHVLGATGRVPRPLNEFEIEPLVSDLKDRHGGKKNIKNLRIAYEAAWARLQHQQPGYTLNEIDASFQADLLAWLRFHEAMLIGEVIPQLHEYLRSNPIADERREYIHILVDEYQDLNRAEQQVIELLSDEANVCIVGDDNQSIYSFKHAHPEGIQEWSNANAGAYDVNLEECHRCPTRIVEMANSLISYNQRSRLFHPLIPMHANGRGDIRIVQYRTMNEEITGVATLVSQMISDGVQPSDILILSQSRAIGTRLYNTLIEREIPTKSYYAESELSNKESCRAFALLKLFANRYDRVALRWLIGVNDNNWHATGYRRVREYCESTGTSPWDIMCRLENGALHLPYTRRIVSSFTRINQNLQILETFPDLAPAIDFLFPSEEYAIRDIRELALTILGGMENDNLNIFIDELSTAISQPDIPTEIEDVRIMSLHKSKGLSVPVTIIAGCVQGLLPRLPTGETILSEQARLLEEQRRLFYVGITRVKATPDVGNPGTLILTYSQRMPIGVARSIGIAPAQQQHGSAILHASQFIQELGQAAPYPVAG